MMGITMLIANYTSLGGIVPAASKVPVDWITKRNQKHTNSGTGPVYL